MTTHELHAAAHDVHGHGRHHDDHHDHHGEEGPHSTFSGYLIGFVLSVILTAIPFAVVMGGFLERTPTVILITVCAVAQILVHMVFFLHLNAKIEAGWTLLSTIFTIVFLCITIAGTLWVMYNMNVNMMPHMHDSVPAERNDVIGTNPV